MNEKQKLIRKPADSSNLRPFQLSVPSSLSAPCETIQPISFHDILLLFYILLGLNPKSLTAS